MSDLNSHPAPAAGVPGPYLHASLQTSSEGTGLHLPEQREHAPTRRAKTARSTSCLASRLAPGGAEEDEFSQLRGQWIDRKIFDPLRSDSRAWKLEHNNAHRSHAAPGMKCPI